MEDLPIEVCLHLLRYLDEKDILACGSVSKYWQPICEDESEWKRRCIRDWKMTRRVGIEASLTWKQVYAKRFTAWNLVRGMKLDERYLQNDLVRLSDDKIGIKYLGDDAHSDTTVGVASTASPLLPIPFGDVPIYAYFEMNVINQGEYSYVAIGLAPVGYPLCRGQPGWRRGSTGFHGDDGTAFMGHGFGNAYSEAYGTGMTVGCLYNLVTRELSYTRQGRLLPSMRMREPAPVPLYGLISTHSRNEEVQANFGTQPFVFDVAAHISQAMSTIPDGELETLATRIGQVVERIENHQADDADPEPSKQQWAKQADNTFGDLLEVLQDPNAAENPSVLGTVRTLVRHAGVHEETVESASPQQLIQLGRMICYIMHTQQQQQGDQSEDEEDDEEDDYYDVENDESGEEENESEEESSAL